MKKKRDPFRMALVYAGPEQMAARRRASQEAPAPEPEPAPAPYPLNYAEGETEVTVTEFRDVSVGPEMLEMHDTICGAVYAGPDAPRIQTFQLVYAGPDVPPTPVTPPLTDAKLFQAVYAGPVPAPSPVPTPPSDLPQTADGGEEDTVRVTCPMCGDVYSARGSFCPSCGAPRPKEES